MTTAQRVALVIALGAGLLIIGRATVPFSVGGSSCGSPVSAAFVDDRINASRIGVSRSAFSANGRGRTGCEAEGRSRLVTGAIGLGLVVAFGAGSYVLLRDAPGGDLRV